LKYIDRLSWPAVEAEPAQENELFLILGNNFHKLAHQHFLGLHQEELTAIADTNENLSAWWDKFKIFQSKITDLSTGLYPEISFSIPISDHRLLAKFDLLTIDTKNRLIIYDWKTSRNIPRKTWLQYRLQTRVYPFILVQSANSIFHLDELSPNKIEMVYWFTNHPTEPVRFPYDAEQYKRDEAFLTQLMRQAAALQSEEKANLTTDRKLCKYCVYRSLCNRGAEAGLIDEWELEEENELEINFDFEQIAEIDY
jgi:hypothetical protein